MNIKYKYLSVIGKVWTIAEILFAGIREEKEKWIVSALDKLEGLREDETIQNSKALNEKTIDQLIENARTQKQIMLEEQTLGGLTSDGGSVVETIWFNRIEFDEIKRRIKNDGLLEEDLLSLNQIYREIKAIWIKDLKEKQLSSKERSDLFKIKEEIEDLKIKIEKRVERNQITII
ncbi:MAG: hypothetical protein J6Q13_02850 [Clostridia bacterium]|nr:hypothetical protein [Clostridia bacterium]